MPTTLALPVIPGFAGEVEQFAAEHGITDAVFAIFDVTRRIFHQAKQVRVESYVDHDDESWDSVYFKIVDWPLSVEATQGIDDAWYRETHDLIPFDLAWRIGHRIEWRE